MNYSVFQETLSDRENGQYLTYGIQTGEKVVHDLSTNREAVMRLVNRLNADAAADPQLPDILEDFLP